MPRVFAVDGHVDDGAGAVAVVILATRSTISFALPAATACPSTVAVMPVTADFFNVRYAAAVDFLCRRPFCRLLLMGCEDAHSASAAYSSSCASSIGL